jgi:para-aminobenzoate synthetase
VKFNDGYSSDGVMYESYSSTDFPFDSDYPNSRGAQLHTRVLDVEIDCANAYRLISSVSAYSFWLDSAREESPMSRYSYMGVVPDEATILLDANVSEFYSHEVPGAHATYEFDGTGKEISRSTGNVAQTLRTFLSFAPKVVDAPAELSQALLGGYVGYFGYEFRAHTEPASPVTHHASTPDALWMQAVRYMIHDHHTGTNWLVGDSQWLDEIETVLRTFAESNDIASTSSQQNPLSELVFAVPTRESYTADVRECQREIYEGNSYEICLTAQTRAQASASVNKEDALAIYLAQRQHNAAPYAAFVHCNDFYILSSSPERFLSISPAGRAETKPIKGTIARFTDPAEDARRATWLKNDPKTRAENLMIVDLLRNDLSRVSYSDSVQVPVLMGVESYSTVHQLVSTVRSLVRPDVHPVDAVLACFPGGSMTGAPKPSTMDIIDRLEGRARGVYSGALGFFSESGAVNLSIVIRTLVVAASGEVTLSAGGAIVADSDPDAEYDEMVTKLRAALPPGVGKVAAY